MTFVEAIGTCLAKYADFEGHASRAEFWWFALFVTLGTTAFTYIHDVRGHLSRSRCCYPSWPRAPAASARLGGVASKYSFWFRSEGIIILGFWWAEPPYPRQRTAFVITVYPRNASSKTGHLLNPVDRVLSRILPLSPASHSCMPRNPHKPLHSQKPALSLIARYSLMVVLALGFASPILFMLVSSFKPYGQLLRDTASIRAILPVGALSFENYRELFAFIPVGRFLFN